MLLTGLWEADVVSELGCPIDCPLRALARTGSEMEEDAHHPVKIPALVRNCACSLLMVLIKVMSRS